MQFAGCVITKIITQHLISHATRVFRSDSILAYFPRQATLITFRGVKPGKSKLMVVHGFARSVNLCLFLLFAI
jgi:hypothetical protein